jgi:hypothetical protein
MHFYRSLRGGRVRRWTEPKIKCRALLRRDSSEARFNYAKYLLEALMRGFIATVGLGSLLILNAGGSIAFADNASFRFANNTPETIFVKLHSEARAGWQWPGATKHWILNPGQKGTVAAGACQPGEKICYGGGNKDHSRFWGVSLDGKKGCSNCCIECGNSHGWNLTEHSDPPSQPHNTIDDGPALVPVEE